MVGLANEELVLQGEDHVEMVVMHYGSGDHFKHIYRRVVVVHTFDPSTQKAKAGGFLDFQDSLGSTEKLCLEENKNNIFDHTCFQGGLAQSAALNSSVT